MEDKPKDLTADWRIHKDVKTGSEVVHAEENNDEKPWICQFIVGAGGNDDPEGMGGMAHFTEHFLIHSSCMQGFPVKVHGFTSFYYTCYYWYADSQEQAMELFDRFDEMIRYMGSSQPDHFVFEETKREIVLEIEYTAGKKAEIEEAVFLVRDEVPGLRLPIGYTRDVMELCPVDVQEFLMRQYTELKTYRYIYDRDYDVYLYKNAMCRSVCFEPVYQDAWSEAGEIPENLEIIRKRRQGADHRIAVRNVFSASFMDVMFSEIFFMQVCEYLNSKLYAADIHYEKLKIDRETSFFIITIRGMEESDYKQVFLEDRLEISRLLKRIMNPDRFREIIADLTGYASSFRKENVSEEDVRMGLIDHTVLSYPCMELIGQREKIIRVLKEMDYRKYDGCIRNMLIRFGKKVEEYNYHILCLLPGCDKEYVTDTCLSWR